MTRLAKTSLFGILGLSVAFVGSTDLLACGRGGGGGYRGGYGGGISHNYTPSYSQPSYYRPPVYQQPVQPIVRQQHVQPVQQQFPQQQFPQQQVQQQPVQQQGFQQQTVAQQPIQSQPIQQQPVQQQSVQQQPVQTAQTVQPQQQTQQVPAQQTQAQPQQQQSQVQQAQTQPAQTQPQTPSNAQQSALQILASFEGTDATETSSTTPQPQTQAFTGIGTWSASLTNGAAITLELDADGTFTWTAVKGGKPSTFSGTYILNGGTLTLNRTDNQKLTGSLLAATTNGFTFKLDGVKDNGLQFARS